MKYSQAIIVVAIASAAVVSAAPSTILKPAPAIPAADQTGTTPAATTAAPHSHHKKDLFDGEALFEREFDEAFDELVARGRLGGLIKTARKAVKGHKFSGAIAAVNAASTAASFLAPQQRDFGEELDELVARARLGGFVNKVRKGMKGHKVDAVLAALDAGSTAASFMAPQRRHFDGELDELVARGRLGGIVNKIRNGMKGHKVDAALAALDAGSTAASFMAPQQRDLSDFDELQMRDFDFEIDVLD